MKQLLNMMNNGCFPLIVSLPCNKPELARCAWENGADVVKVHINVKHHASSTLYGSYKEEQANMEQIRRDAKGPLGIVPGAGVSDVEGDLDLVLSAGFDFISLYGHHAPVHMPDSMINKMIAPDYTWQDWEIALLEEVGADILEASVMHPDSYGQPLSMREMITYRHLSEISTLPMVIPTQRFIRPDQVSALRQNGAGAIMIGAVVTGKEEASVAAAVKAFRNAIDKMRTGEKQ